MLDVRQQHVIVEHLERTFVSYLPVIPLTNGVHYGGYNVRHGGPTASDNDAMQGVRYDRAAG
jgi:hypothetical protein